MSNLNFKYNHIETSFGNTDFQIIFVDNWFQNDGWEAEPHEHLFCECHYLKNGSISLKISEQYNKVFSENTFFIFPIGIEHEIETVTLSQKRICFYITATRNNKSNYNTYDLFNGIFSADNAVIYEKNFFYLDLIIKLLENYEQNDFLFKESLTHLFSLFLIELFEGHSLDDAYNFEEENIGYKNETLLKIETFIDSELSYNSKPEHLSEYLCLSLRQTNRILNTVYGKSFREIKNEKIINQAKNLISETDFSFKEIAEKLGYNSYNGFYKMFKIHTGNTPEFYKINASKFKK